MLLEIYRAVNKNATIYGIIRQQMDLWLINRRINFISPRCVLPWPMSTQQIDNALYTDPVCQNTECAERSK